METLTLSRLREANLARHEEWWGGNPQAVTLSFRGNELAGETGEACNVIKKLERARLGIAGSRASLEDLADELADVVICADLCAMDAGVDLAAAIVRKFNATSDKVGMKTRLPETEIMPLPYVNCPECGWHYENHEVADWRAGLTCMNAERPGCNGVLEYGP